MNPADLKQRTRRYGLRILRMADSLPRSRSSDVIARQIIRAGTSVGANYRAACRARSKPDFVSKMTVVEEELDETLYWMELILDAGLQKPAALAKLMQEAQELLSITVVSINTARGGPRARSTRKSAGSGR